REIEEAADAEEDQERHFLRAGEEHVGERATADEGDRLAPIALRDGVERALDGLLARERFHDARAGERLLRALREIAERLLHRLAVAVQARREPAGGAAEDAARERARARA